MNMYLYWVFFSKNVSKIVFILKLGKHVDVLKFFQNLMAYSGIVFHIILSNGNIVTILIIRQIQLPYFA